MVIADERQPSWSLRPYHRAYPASQENSGDKSRCASRRRMKLSPLQNEIFAHESFQVSAATYAFPPLGIRFDSLASFNTEMEPSAYGDAAFIRYGKTPSENIRQQKKR